MIIRTQRYDTQISVSNDPDSYNIWGISHLFDKELDGFEQHEYEAEYQLGDILNLP